MRSYDGKRASTQKAVRTVLLAILFHTYWPKRLSRKEITGYLSYYYGETSTPALYRDLQTLTGIPVEELPEPDAENLAGWCEEQRGRKRLAITYERRTATFGLAQSFFSIDINEDEARAFVALQEGFAPGTPYAGAVQNLLQRWEWLFTEKSRQLVRQKRKRHARPVLLPLSPVVDYSQHGETILSLDQALEEGAYVSFAYTPLVQSWDAEPVWHEHIEPFELEYRDGHWYFTGFVFESNTFLDFRVDRMRPGSLHKKHEHFHPGSRQRPGVRIRYWVSPMLARHGSLSVRLRDQQVTMLEGDQGAIVEGVAKSVWWARRLLLGYGEQVKALEPEKLVLMMRETAGVMHGLYEEEK
ncbi:MAG: WYL domain-containing protein [Chloroflexi bacterium]|nr:MAG: WYL domain-containing protein [Chloroflexota bacterium]